MDKQTWHEGDFERIVAAAGDAFSAQLAAREIVITRPSAMVLTINAVSRWELVIRGGRRYQVVAVVNPAEPVFGEDEVAALRRMARECRLGDALRAAGRPSETKLARVLASEVLV